MNEVILGMPGPWADSNYEASDHYTTKIGGIPDWCFPVLNAKPHLLECNECGSNLNLVAQVYAPISSESLEIEERVVYVFGCLAPHCNSIPWRALRIQRISNVGKPLIPCNQMVYSTASSDSTSNNNFKENLLSFDNGEEHGDETDDDIDLEELGRALSEAAISASAGREQSSRKPLLTDHPARCIDNKVPVLPCFYIYTQNEKLSTKVTSKSSKDPSILIEAFEETMKIDSDGETYFDESYEYDKATNADRTYLKFKKRMDAYPEQCFRCSYGGRPLLACEEAGDPGSCGLCGEPRHYEMQLMSPLIYFLQEAADDLQRISLEKFNWLTLLVYTCSKSCADRSQSNEGEDWIVAEEAVIIQHE